MKALFENKNLEIEGFEIKNMCSYAPMFHSHGEILYVKSGTVSVTVDGNKAELTGGKMCVVFPYCVHSYEPHMGSEVAVVLFSAESVGEFSKVLFSKTLQNPFFEYDEGMYNLIKKILFHSKGSTPLCHNTCGAYLKALMGEILLAASFKTTSKTDDYTVRSVMKYCSEHFSEDILVKDICDNVFVSERYVSKIFVEKVGCSFREYINSLRISKAKQLLETTTMSITDVIYECGFKNQSTFNRVFLKKTGITPGEYKKKVSRGISVV